jgi:hypothetical protein
MDTTMACAYPCCLHPVPVICASPTDIATCVKKDSGTMSGFICKENCAGCCFDLKLKQCGKGDQ